MSSWLRVLRRGCFQNEWLAELAFVPVALVCSWCLLATKNLPNTHDGMGLVFIEAYRRAYLAGDWFPTWTVFGEHGHGSAIFILYHRLHAQLAALLALKTGTVVALKVSIPFWLAVGGVGMRRYCRLHGVRPWVAWIAGVLLMSSHYGVTDWYIRGATAELAAFMLVPWGLRYATELFERKWGAVRLAIATALIFLAHMLIFYFFVVTAAVVIAGAFLRLRAYGWTRMRAAMRRAVAFVLLLSCAIGPYAAAVTYATEFSGISKLGLRTQPRDFAPWSNLFADPNHSWSRVAVEGEMTLEIGRWTLLCLGVFLLLAPAARKAVWQRAGGLALLAAWYVALQHFGMMFWIELLPGASKIQFPIRLLVYVSVVAILCATIAIEYALRTPMQPVRLLACVLPLLAAAFQGNQIRGMQSAIWWLNVDRTDADEALSNDTDVLTRKVSMNQSWDDFIPNRHGNNSPVQPFLKTLGDCFITSPALTHGVPVATVEKNVAGPVSFTTVGKDCTVKINQIHSSLLRVSLSKPGKMRETDDGLMLVDAPIDGTVVTIRERSVMDLAKKFVIEKMRRFP